MFKIICVEKLQGAVWLKEVYAINNTKTNKLTFVFRFWSSYFTVLVT